MRVSPRAPWPEQEFHLKDTFCGHVSLGHAELVLLFQFERPWTSGFSVMVFCHVKYCVKTLQEGG